MKIYIKYMVSIRCKLIVKNELDNLGIHYDAVHLGEVDIPGGITQEQRENLGAALKKTGLEILNDKRAILAEKIKTLVIETIHYADEAKKINITRHLSEKLNYDYTYLANLFSEVEGTTIERFIIKHKIERVKELLFYDELPLTEIAYKLHYSSVAHLSSQFKKVTGHSPTFYKKLGHARLNGLEQL